MLQTFNTEEESFAIALLTFVLIAGKKLVRPFIKKENVLLLEHGYMMRARFTSTVTLAKSALMFP